MDMTNLRLVIAQILAGVALALTIVNFMVGPEIMAARLAAAFGTTTQIGDAGTIGILALSAAAFVLSLKRRSFLLAGLLVATGIVFLMAPVRAMEHFSSMGAMGAIHVGSFGLGIIGLGVAKGIGTARRQKTSPSEGLRHGKL